MAGNRKVPLDTGYSKIQVDIITMGYSPLGDVGFQNIHKGDRVSVAGRLAIDVPGEDHNLCFYQGKAVV
ncbi:MAG: hypothetical protein MUP90_17890 [Gammaproteobacteria bacterium]|nr:hypothetical protein [Gammaproteobacteria bacterium]